MAVLFSRPLGGDLRRWGNLSPSFGQFHFIFAVIFRQTQIRFPPALNKGNLRDRGDFPLPPRPGEKQSVTTAGDFLAAFRQAIRRLIQIMDEIFILNYCCSSSKLVLQYHLS
jgi:hypothetical protein